MDLVAHVAGERPAQRAFLFLQAVAIEACLGWRQDADRKVKAIATVACDLIGREQLGHGASLARQKNFQKTTTQAA